MKQSSAWQWPEQIPPLGPGELQIWRLDARGDRGESPVAAGRALLSPGELLRAEASRVEVARREFVAGRALLRRLLGAALGCDPKDVAFGFGANGKPRVTPAAGVEFNLSHSRGMVVAGIARGVAVGVDVEWIDPAFAKGGELLAIVDEHFNPAERMLMRRTVSESDRLRAFYAAWTRKEAISKAFGLGIASVLGFADGRAEKKSAPLDAAGDADWAEANGSFVRSFQVAAGFAAAVAVAGQPRPVESYDAARLFDASSLHQSE